MDVPEEYYPEYTFWINSHTVQSHVFRYREAWLYTLYKYSIGTRLNVLKICFVFSVNAHLLQQ